MVDVPPSALVPLPLSPPGSSWMGRGIVVDVGATNVNLHQTVKQFTIIIEGMVVGTISGPLLYANQLVKIRRGMMKCGIVR